MKISKYLTLSVCFFALVGVTAVKANKIADELKEFSRKTYNALPLSAQADGDLRSNGNLKTVLNKTKSVVQEYGLTSSIGFRLAHRHDLLPKNKKVMTENFEMWKGAPSFVTIMEKVDSETYPASWLYTSSGLKVFEYSKDPKVGEVASLLSKKVSLFSKIEGILKEHKLDKILAPSIIARAFHSKFDQEQPLYEIIQPSPYASVLVNRSWDDIELDRKKGWDLVQTSWALNNEKYNSVCTTMCFVSQNIHIFEHRKKDEDD